MHRKPGMCDASSMEPTEARKNVTGVSRRRLLGAGSLIAGSAAAVSLSTSVAHASAEKPALLGGKPVKPDRFPVWPVFDSTEENTVVDVVRSGKWGRGGGTRALKFEQLFAELMNARHCLAT